MQKRSAIKPLQTMRGHSGWVRRVVHLPGGRRIFTSSVDGSLALWDLKSGIQIGKKWRDDEDKPEAMIMALSPNGKTVAAGSSDGTMRLWDVEMEKVITKWRGHTRKVESVCWSADGERVVSGSSDTTARIWDVKSGEIMLGPIETGHEYIWVVICSPDTTKIATGGIDNSGNPIKIWDTKTGELLSMIKLETIVFCLAWTSDGKKLISGSYDGSIRIFDTATLRQIAIIGGHKYEVYAISLFQNEQLLASASLDNTVRLWNLDTKLPVGPPLQHTEGVDAAAISTDEKLLVTGCRDHNAYVWDIHDILTEAGLEDPPSIPDASAFISPILYH
jgi:WD40 repeat protein